MNLRQRKKDENFAFQVTNTQSIDDDEIFDIDESEALAVITKNFNKIMKRMGHKSKPT